MKYFFLFFKNQFIFNLIMFQKLKFKFPGNPKRLPARGGERNGRGRRPSPPFIHSRPKAPIGHQAAHRGGHQAECPAGEQHHHRGRHWTPRGRVWLNTGWGNIFNYIFFLIEFFTNFLKNKKKF